MDASSSSSSSVPCSKKPISEPPTLSSLPEELILRIIATVASTGKVSDFFHVAGVSKQFRRLSEEPSVLRSVGAHIFRNSLGTSAPYRERLFQGCLASDDPHAQFVQGKADYFLNQRREIGLKLLISSANQGHQKATYVCGMLLLCLGGLDKKRGLDMLYSLMHPSSVYMSMSIVGDLQHKSALRWWHVGYVAETFRELKQGYVRDPCSCNGKTTAFVKLGALERYHMAIRGKDLPASEACLICFWDHQVQRFLYGYD